jgi:osmoprotectant transport system permease protein
VSSGLLSLLPERLAWHVVLSAAALGLGLLIALPLGVLAARSPRLRWPSLALAGLVQTIPSLALLALFYPLLLLLSNLAKGAFGHGFSALGFLPSLLALTLYSMLPILRNAVTGLTGVDPAVVEAARGVGMTDRQRLWRVELPLAAPVIMAGVRTAAVWTIGAATLSTPVGQTSLGDYIFSGLQTENWAMVLTGCVASAVLALVVDQLLGLIERGTERRDRRLWGAGLLGLAAGLALAVAPLAADLASRPARYVIGAKNFSEQYILAELMADRLEGKGAQVTRKINLGSAVAYRALAAGEIDAYVDYSGTLWANVLGRKDNPGRTSEDLAQRVALSPSAVQRRLRKLKEAGVIVRQTAVLEPRKVGRPTFFIVSLEIERDRPELLTQLRIWLAAQEHVQQAFYVTGEADFILVVTAPDTETYDALMARLTIENPNVRKFTTNVALGVVKRGLTIPVSLDEE